MFRVLFESRFTRMISTLKYKWPPWAITKDSVREVVICGGYANHYGNRFSDFQSCNYNNSLRYTDESHETLLSAYTRSTLGRAVLRVKEITDTAYNEILQ